MLVKALRPIAAGEELYLNYIAYDTLLQRSEKISAWFPVCACPDCQRDRSATPEALQKRHKLMNADCLHEWVEGNLQYLYRTLKTVQECTEQVKSTFSPQLLSSETPFELGILYDKEGDVHAIIGRHLHSQEEFKKAIRCRKKALEGFGVQLKQAAWKIKHGSDLPVVTLPLRRFERIINICTSLQGLYALLGHSKAEETAWLKAGEWINDSIVAPGLYNLMHG